MNPLLENDRVKLTLLITFLLFFIIFIVSFLLFSNRSESISINNYDTYTKNLPSEQRDSINNSLYLAVKGNLVDGEKIIYSAAAIRKGSASESYNSERDVNSGEFIVDLEGIRQSYKVTYDWSKNKNNPNTSGYPITVRCLSEKEEMIYKDFDCKDDSEELGLPLQYQLPYSDVAGPFTIGLIEEDNGSVENDNTAVAITDSTPNGRKAALDWLRSRRIDPVDVSINYVDLNSQIYEVTKQ
ncbi:MAG TPA: hypothetical protein VGE34_04080 [Candidatus Saccharimonadales bacterium]